MIQAGIHVGDRAARCRVSGVAHARSPAVAATDRRKPASSTVNGSATSMARAARPSAAAARPGRPSSRAESTTPAMSAARTTLGDAPASTV